MNIEEIIKSVISEITGIEYEEINNEDYIMEDLGADELDFVNIVRKIEQELSLKIENINLKDITVGDLIELVIDAPNALNNKDSEKSLHYLFAHLVIPGFIFQNGVNLFPMFRFKNDFDYMPNTRMVAPVDEFGREKNNGLEYLHEWWNGYAKHANCSYEKPDGIDYEMFERNGNYMILFYFPKPVEVGDAYLGLFVWRNKDINVDDLDDFSKIIQRKAKYYTLEHSFNNQCVIGEWTSDNEYLKHITYTTRISEESFIDVVVEDFLNETTGFIVHTAPVEPPKKTVNEEYSFDKIRSPELKKAWSYFLNLNNQLPDEKKMTFGVMPWAYTQYIDCDPDVDMIIYTNNKYKNVIKNCGNALYISNNKGGVLFITENDETLKSGVIIDLFRLIKHPDLKDKKGNINPEYKDKLYPNEFILWNSDYDVKFAKDISKDDAFIDYHYYKDWLGADVQGEFRLTEKNLNQLFINLQNNENNMKKYLNTKFKLF